MVAAAVIGAGVIGAVGSNMAASKQSGGQQQAAQTQMDMFNKINGQEQPFIQAGYGATDSLSQLMGLTGTPGSNVGSTGLKNGYLTSAFSPTQEQLDQYPGYQFALKTGGQAVRNADTPGIGALSGAALKDLTNFNVGTANQFYNQYFNQDLAQKNSIYSRLSSLAGLGQNAATQTGNAGAQLGQGVAQAQAGAAASQAGGIVGATNNLAGGSLAGMMYLNGGRGGAMPDGTGTNLFANSSGGDVPPLYGGGS